MNQYSQSLVRITLKLKPVVKKIWKIKYYIDMFIKDLMLSSERVSEAVLDKKLA